MGNLSDGKVSDGKISDEKLSKGKFLDGMMHEGQAGYRKMGDQNEKAGDMEYSKLRSKIMKA